MSSPHKADTVCMGPLIFIFFLLLPFSSFSLHDQHPRSWPLLWLILHHDIMYLNYIPRFSPVSDLGISKLKPSINFQYETLYCSSFSCFDSNSYLADTMTGAPSNPDGYRL
jgi:hypothetical protein